MMSGMARRGGEVMRRSGLFLAAALLALGSAGCGDERPDPAPGTSAQATAVPSTSAEASESPTPGIPPVVFKVGALKDYPQAITDSAGRAVYTFSGDEHGAVTCLDACAARWPGVLTGGDPTISGTFDYLPGTQPRGDGTDQATYGGDPLYYYAGDTAPGSANGVGKSEFGGRFALVAENSNGILG
jgi:predicted lipoprotein with Yx(FWY)xxD motif